MKLLLYLFILLSINSIVYSKDEYFFIRPDFRKCAAPRCGGNFLTKLNDQDAKEYHQIEMQMIDATIRTSLLNNYTNIIVYGELNTASIDNGQNEYYSLFLKGIYQVMELPPNENPNPSLVRVKEKYFKLTSSGCESDYSACSSITANLINVGDTSDIKNYNHPYDAVPVLDQQWFDSRFFGSVGTSAILKGYIVGNNIKVSKVYAFTSDPHSTCPSNESNCTGKQVATFTRKDGSRCPVFTGCVNRGPCPLVIPQCSQGYTQYRLPSNASRGCPKYYCDPSFLIDPIKAGDP